MKEYPYVKSLQNACLDLAKIIIFFGMTLISIIILVILVFITIHIVTDFTYSLYLKQPLC